ncbi:site-specific integrase [Aquabacterium sp. OR-4]|uniref:site-specific integrase n=1 Tax=Aquabacterium sp. OR-4 TaxID=2978127 RepID=UPI0021B31B53|nr:site-specific integrase [Aquabacterium sp. OR-4]MDT7838530.1 site-specific integrase [Aquabacterium sp. OR-4]
MSTPAPARQRSVASAAAARRLGSHQMAFVRAWAEGLAPAQAWQRYLGQGQGQGQALPDGRRVRAELQRLLDVLRGVARAQGRPELAALLRRDPEAMVEPVGQQPSLDDFRAQQPEDFYSEAELLALYEASHGAPDTRGANRRRQRLRARQVAALQWLETVAVREPRPEDALAGWLDERLAARLAQAGMLRLAQLKQRMLARGFHWHRGVHRVGPAAALRLVQWWQEHARSLGALPGWVFTPPAQLDRATLQRRPAVAAAPAMAAGGAAAGPRAHGLPPRPVPLDRLQVPAGLTGRHGLFRAPAQARQISADDDQQALQAWLARHPPGSATWRAYRKEAERLQLWALWVAGKPLSSLDAADLRAFEAFLQSPPPDWTAPRGTPRWHDDWRPLEGPLADRSRAMAVGILRGMLAWWTAQGYLAVNCWTVGADASSAGVAPGLAGAMPANAAGAASAQADAPAAERAPATALAPAHGLPTPPSEPAPPQAKPAEAWPAGTRPPLPRALHPDHQAALQQWLARRIASQGHTPALLRLQALLGVAMDAGLRPAELIAARVGWLQADAAVARPDIAMLDAAPAPGPAAWLRVERGPGGPARQLVLTAGTAQALQRYLAQRCMARHDLGQGVEALSSAGLPADAPLFAQLRAEAGLSAARLYEVMRQALAECADEVSSFKPDAALALRHASTIWLRHGFGLRVAAAGVRGARLQDQTGHRGRASVAAYRRLALAEGAADLARQEGETRP